MKKILLLTVATVLVLSANNSYADSKSATATVKATIVGAGSVTKAQDMNFGTIVSSGNTQVAKLSPDGELTGVITARGEPVTAAQFNVTGDEGLSYTLSVADTQLTSGSNRMTLNNYVILVDDATYVGSTNKITDNGDTVKVGADLNIGANQASGDYQGTITLTMSY